MSEKAILVGPCLDRRKLSYTPDTPIIFVDGGLKYKKSHFNKSINWQSIGDQDSTRLKPQIKLSKRKNESDLHHALKLLPKNIHWVEAFGLFPDLKNEQRLDHRLFNLGEIYNFVASSGISVILNDDEVLIPAGKNQLEWNGEFSLIAFENVKLKIAGQVAYPLHRLTKITRLSSHTLSNRAHGELTIQCSHPLLLYSAPQKKSSLKK